MNVWIPITINIVRYIFIAGFMFIFFYKLFPGYFSKNKIQDKIAKTKDFIREISHSLKTTVVIAAVSVMIFSTPLAEYSQVYYNINDMPLWWIPVSVVLMLIIHDTYFYWMHKTVHHPKLFKHIHLVHHKSINPTPFASFSFHIYESILEGLIAPILLLTLPLHPLSLLIFSTFSFLFNAYGHLGYEIMPKWFRRSFLFEILNTSTHHNIHHSKFKGNFGLYFRLWDRVMKTENPNYVKEYDVIQNRRFGKKEASNHSWKSVITIFISGIALLSLLSFTNTKTSSIEGIWRNDELGVVVKILKKDNLYFGQVLSSDNPEDDNKIKANGMVVLLKNFKKQNETTYCCGKLYAPKKGIMIDATMTLKDANTIRLVGVYGIITKSSTFKKI